MEEIANGATYENDEINDYEDLPKRLIKKWVILRNRVQEWKRANKYFRDHQHHNNEVKMSTKK